MTLGTPQKTSASASTVNTANSSASLYAPSPSPSPSSVSAYETRLREDYQSHWAPGYCAEWAVNHLLLQKLARNCTDLATKDQLKLRSFGFGYLFSHQTGMNENLHWQVSPLNNDDTTYHRNRIAPPSLKSDEALKEAKLDTPYSRAAQSSPNLVAVSSPRAGRSISRQMVDPKKILGVIESNEASLATPRQTKLPTSLLVVDGHVQDERFHMPMVHSGYAANPAKAIETIIATCTSEEALRKCCANLHVRAFVEHGLLDQTHSSPLQIDPNAPSWTEIGTSAAARCIESGMRSLELAPCIGKVGAVMLSNIRGLEQMGPRLDALAKEPAQKILLSHMRTRMQKNLNKAASHIDSPLAYINDIRMINEDITTVLAVMQPYEKHELDLHMPNAGKVPPAYSMRNSGLNAFHSILTAGEEMSRDGSMPRVLTQANSYYESVYAIKDSAEYTKLPAMVGLELANSMSSLKQTLGGQKVDVFVCQFHDNISANLHAYHPQNLLEQVNALLKSGLASDRLTIAVDTTIGRQDAPELKALVASLAPLIENGKVNLVVFRSGLKFDLAGMDSSSTALITTYNNGDKHWKQYNESTASPHAMRGVDFQLHTHVQKHSSNGINEYRSAIAKQHRDMMARLPTSVITSPATGLASGAVQVLFNDDPDMSFMDLRPSPELLAAGGDAADIARAIRLAVEFETGQPFRHRPSFGFAHSTMAPIDETRERITLGLEDAHFMETVAKMIAAANDVGTLAVKLGDPQKTKDFFNDTKAIMVSYRKANSLRQQ